MNTKRTRIKPLLLSALFAFASLSVPKLVLADSFPFSAAPVAEKPSASVTKPALVVKDVDTANFPFLQGLELTAEQKTAIKNILNKQMPVIATNVEVLESARAFLREMAVTKTYDEIMANVAADNIATSTAKLALLQAEREYQVLALLTPEQVSQFEKN